MLTDCSKAKGPSGSNARVQACATRFCPAGVKRRAPCSSRWEEFIEHTALRDRFDIIRCDLRGHAASVCRGRARIEDWCADTAAVLDAEGIDKAVIVGHSLGAQVAVNFSARYAERVRGCALLDPLLAAGGEELEEFIREYSSAKADLQYIHSAVYLRDLVEVGRPTPAPEKIKAPMLVIGASAGTFTNPEAMQAWVGKLTDGTWAQVQCAHWPMTECPQDVAAVIEKWVFARFAPAS